MRISDWSSDVCSADLSGITRLEHLTQLDLTALLNSQLQYEQQQRLNQLAPSHLEVPTGSRIRLDYQPPDAPTLAVKLQEMFGCLQTPCVNGGRTKVIVHLLSPAQRPIAVTHYLGGLWTSRSPDVPKDPRGLYPRHPWPKDPLSASPRRPPKPPAP